jgi:translocation and assembly module TamA
MRRHWLLWAVVGAAAVLAPAPGAAQTFERDSVSIVSLEFIGASAFDDEELRSAIATSTTRCSSPVLALLCLVGLGVERHYLDDRTLGADVLRLRLFYFARGYRDARITVDSTRAERSVRLRFHIDEGAPVRVASIGFEQTADLPVDVFRELPLRPNESFSMPLYEATRDTLTARLRGLGYAHAQVMASYLIPRDNSLAAEVLFDIDRGERSRFGRVEIIGADRVSPRVVRRMLEFDSGGVYDQRALAASQRNLFGLEVFRHAEVVALTGSPNDTVVPVRVQVNEGNIHRVRFGAGLNTAEFASVEGRWLSRNFLGGARRLELRGRVSHLGTGPLAWAPVFEGGEGIYAQRTFLLSADFAQPWFLHRAQTLRSGLFYERRIVTDVYVRTSRGGYVSLNRALGRGMSVGLAYRPELTRLESDGDLIFCVSLLACEEADIRDLSASHRLSPVALTFVRDASNSVFAPTRGSILRLDLELAGAPTFSEFRYARLTGELADYRLLAGGVVLASRLRPGIAMAEFGEGLGLHPQKRFFAGGASSVRGFAQYRLGPRLLTIGADTLRGGTDCTTAEINAGSCAADALAASTPGAFEERPVGGSLLIEGNVEVRFPLIGALHGAAFVDFGQVWADRHDVRPADIMWTPGIGVRYHSMLGPIRVDVGYNPQGAQRIDVIATCPAASAEEPGCGGIEQQLTRQPAVDWQPYRSVLSRLQLHFSIGQAF